MTIANTESVRQEETSAPDEGRRSLALTLLGALGGMTFLDACAGEPSGAPLPEPLAPLEQALVGTSAPKWVDTIADLKSLTGMGSGAANVTTVVVLGRNARGDGGGGVFIWVASPLAVGDDGTTFLPAPQTDASDAADGSYGPGYWMRVYSGPLDIRWFGASTAASNNEIAIQKALDAIPTGAVVLVPPGTFRVSGTIVLPSRATLRGAGSGTYQVGWASVLTTTNPAIPVLRATDKARIVIEQLAITFSLTTGGDVPTPLPSNMAGVELTNTGYCRFSDVFIGRDAGTAFQAGIQFISVGTSKGCISNVITDSQIVNNVTNIEARDNTNALLLSHVTFGGTSSIGLSFLNSNNLTVIGGDCEGVSVAAIDIDSSASSASVGVAIHGVHFEGTSATGGDIRLGKTNAVDGVSIAGCLFANSGASLAPVNAVKATNVSFVGNSIDGSYSSSTYSLGTEMRCFGSGGVAISRDTNVVNSGMQLAFRQKNAANAWKDVARLVGSMTGNTSGAEFGALYLQQVLNGVMTTAMQFGNDVNGNSTATLFGRLLMGLAGPSVSAGSGVPGNPEPNGSIYLRTDGTGPNLYVRQNGSWVAK